MMPLGYGREALGSHKYTVAIGYSVEGVEHTFIYQSSPVLGAQLAAIDALRALADTEPCFSVDAVEYCSFSARREGGLDSRSIPALLDMAFDGYNM